ncbi:glycosyltransferase [Streptomyces sp. NBC_00237]|uniref:glycosyltransferase family 2 protein n=1 Tax=Streptomyces sp. NBC_00237 TaxID=2975687 RepID=UPI002254543E|nr:glycosyltransferase family 2 protein [Streptomyces sp. NBC_00237]MCX5205055.1 glycosyltransferase [Streptomyces sp. NBC_00237]
MPSARTAPPAVTVVTPTKGRPHLLTRALASVARQEGVAVQHVVVGDDCPHLADPEALRTLRARFPHAEFLNVTPDAFPDLPSDYLPARLSRLRNLGIVRAHGDYVAHLDDDNAYHPDHLRTLVAALEADEESEVAYSWRHLRQSDGSDFVPDGEDPWHPVPGRRAASYATLVEQGVFVPGSAVVRDAMRVVDGRTLSRVDTNELLVRRDTHRRIPFPTDFSVWQRILETTEDMAFCQALQQHGTVSVCSERATVDYYMGGYSNAAALT